MPLGGVAVQDSSDLSGWPAPAHLMVVKLMAADGTTKDALLVFMNPGDGWKLAVTEAVVAKYAATLKDTDSVAGGK